VAISAARARQICTQSELNLVLQSTTKNIGQLDSKQLKASIRRARTLRDKWRDLAHSQTRDTKSTNPDKLGEANARSSEKGELFDEVLQRFEKRLAKLDDAATKVAKSTKTTRSAKPSAAVDHRADRAEIRSVLNEKTDVLNAPSKKTAIKKAVANKPPTKKATGKKTNTQAAPTAAETNGAIGKPTVKKPRRKTAAANNGAAAAALAAERSPVQSDSLTGADKKRNLKAKTVAKATAVQRSGAPRIEGHISSQGRRNQAKRNAR